MLLSMGIFTWLLRLPRRATSAMKPGGLSLQESALLRAEGMACNKISTVCRKKKPMSWGMGVARGSRMSVMENLLTAGKSMSGGWPSPPLLCLVPTDDLQGCVYYYPHVSHEKLQLQKVKHLQPTHKDGTRTLIPVPITPACRLFFFSHDVAQLLYQGPWWVQMPWHLHPGLTLSLRGSKGGLTKKQRGNPSSKGHGLIS